MRFLLALILAPALLAQSGARLNRLAEELEQNRPVFGVFSTNLTARGGAALAGSSLDFVIVDLEHSPYDPTRLEAFLLGMTDKRRIIETGSAALKVLPIIRLPSSGSERLDFLIKQVLDLGAFGVVVPHVHSAEQALEAVRSMRYPQKRGAPDAEPRGRRGVGYGWAARSWGLTGAEYSERADVWPLDPKGELFLWCMVESREGLANIREILATPGVSGVFVGPSDLAFSLGVGFDDPELERAMETIGQACKQSKTPCGTLTGATGVAKRLDQGYRFLAVGSDSGLGSGVERALQIGRQHKPR
ncbi:MAG: aldolase [Bryobacterales bacterium]|nr:aldolase [Bryobacterales bacterium]